MTRVEHDTKGFQGLWTGTAFSSEGFHLLGISPWEIILIGKLGKNIYIMKTCMLSSTLIDINMFSSTKEYKLCYGLIVALEH